ncbi:hypothetical protein RA210_U530002 [Rubrivivax sp. A210]|nr:hypothetical protein RA210_U530002 [Rubrivivax sp. A210]
MMNGFWVLSGIGISRFVDFGA